jgi:hypothetical protein
MTTALLATARVITLLLLIGLSLLIMFHSEKYQYLQHDQTTIMEMNNYILTTEEGPDSREIEPAIKVGGARVSTSTSQTSEARAPESAPQEPTSNPLVHPNDKMQRIQQLQKMEHEAQKYAHQKTEWEALHIKGNMKGHDPHNHKRMNFVHQPANRGTN